MSVRWAPSASASALPLALPGAAGAAGSGRGARGSARGRAGRRCASRRGLVLGPLRGGRAGPGRAVLFCSLLFLAVLSCAGRGREAAAAVVAPPWRCAALRHSLCVCELRVVWRCRCVCGERRSVPQRSRSALAAAARFAIRSRCRCGREAKERVRVGIGKGLLAAGRWAWAKVPRAAVTALSCRSRRGVGTRMSASGLSAGVGVRSLELRGMVPRVLLATGIRAAVGFCCRGVTGRLFRGCQEFLTAGLGRKCGVGARGALEGQAGPGPGQPAGAAVSLFVAGLLDEMAFKGPLQLYGCYDCGYLLRNRSAEEGAR